MHDGQSFAIGGLTKNSIAGSLKALPGTDELPIIGSLTRSTSFQQDRAEPLLAAIPQLVKPPPAQYPLPTDSFGTINHGKLYFNGSMEGRIQAPASQLITAAAPVANPEEVVAEPAAAPGLFVQIPMLTNVPATPVAPVTPATPVASTAPRGTRRFVVTGEQSIGSRARCQ